jgi:hypothetical protein
MHRQSNPQSHTFPQCEYLIHLKHAQNMKLTFHTHLATPHISEGIQFVMPVLDSEHSVGIENRTVNTKARPLNCDSYTSLRLRMQEELHEKAAKVNIAQPVQQCYHLFHPTMQSQNMLTYHLVPHEGIKSNACTGFLTLRRYPNPPHPRI